ncbi:MAG: imidazole glycerol phosphate synthase cyclase subunit [Gammaproteobacteria bacterium]|nr:imidazole glycerol phosphate synthase cyclase subunit [Gammaproteobacteria bacterium]
MLSKRIIPRLDIKGPNLVKGIHLEGLRVIGHPESFAKKYYEDGADEILYIDTVASLYGRNNLSGIVEKTTRDVFVPICVGGGIRSRQDADILFRCGADKVAINTGAVSNPRVISDMADTYGCQSIVAYIEARRNGASYDILTNNGRDETNIDLKQWIDTVINMGAGEILLTSVDRDGTGLGFDCDLLSYVDKLSVPVILHGGAGNYSHFKQALNSGTDAVCAASVFHYNYIGMNTDDFVEGNTDFIQGKRGGIPKNICPMAISDLKSNLSVDGIQCRTKW